MRLPENPPSLTDLLADETIGDLPALIRLYRDDSSHGHYLHWDKLRRLPPPSGLTHRQWWFILKLRRQAALRPIPLQDILGASFKFCIPAGIESDLHFIDRGAGGFVTLPADITNPQTRDSYIIKSLMEEAITSSQLEGAVTTREVAKELIRTGRRPRDISERMILNNYVTMQAVRELKGEPLTPEIVFRLHRLVTDDTLDDSSAAGRLRTASEERVVSDDYGNVFHRPPPPDQLESRMQAMCDFANGKTPDYFLHPVLRAIILHFWLAYDHPFVDGNGRTARALFYWSMLHSGYWLFEFISISSILRKAPIKYGRSFLLTETDDNDLTYFILSQAEVIRKAIAQLHEYIDRKSKEIKNATIHVRALDLLNHRQNALIQHALKHPGQRYTFASHQVSHGIAYQTARTDLLELADRKLLKMEKTGNKLSFLSPTNLSDRLLQLDKQVR